MLGAVVWWVGFTMTPALPSSHILICQPQLCSLSGVSTEQEGERRQEPVVHLECAGRWWVVPRQQGLGDESDWCAGWRKQGLKNVGT